MFNPFGSGFGVDYNDRSGSAYKQDYEIYVQPIVDFARSFKKAETAHNTEGMKKAWNNLIAQLTIIASDERCGRLPSGALNGSLTYVVKNGLSQDQADSLLFGKGLSKK